MSFRTNRRTGKVFKLRTIPNPEKSKMRGYIFCKICGEDFSDDLRGDEQYKIHYTKEHGEQRPATKSAEQETRELYNRATEEKKRKVLSRAGAGYLLAGDLSKEKFDGHLYDFTLLKHRVIKMRELLK